MSASQARQIIAACVSPFDKKRVVPPNILVTSFISVHIEAWGVREMLKIGSPERSFEGAIFVEGPRWTLNAGNIDIFRMPNEMIDEVAKLFFELSKNKKEAAEDSTDMTILVLGSTAFCLDVVRFLGMDRKGQVDAANDALVKRIARAESGEVIWTDSTNDKIRSGDLFTMFVKAKEMRAFPD